LCHLQHKLTGFYNRDEKFLLRGTDWVFKRSSLRFVFKGLIFLRTVAANIMKKYSKIIIHILLQITTFIKFCNKFNYFLYLPSCISEFHTCVCVCVCVCVHARACVCGLRQLHRHSDSLRAGRSGGGIPVGASFSASVQSGPGAQPLTTDTASRPGVNRRRRGVNHPI